MASASLNLTVAALAFVVAVAANGACGGDVVIGRENPQPANSAPQPPCAERLPDGRCVEGPLPELHWFAMCDPPPPPGCVLPPEPPGGPVICEQLGERCKDLGVICEAPCTVRIVCAPAPPRCK